MKPSHRGFTLVEMLVVIAIILVVVGASVSVMSVFTQGQKVRQAGRLVAGQCLLARQRASSEKAVYFLQFDESRRTMTMWRDANLNRTLDAGDEKAGEEHPLPKSVEFATGGPLMSLPLDACYLKFFPDGACVLPCPDLEFDPDKDLADLVLVQAGQTHRLYIDFNPASGKVRKQAYRS